jgi:hypothetical protein
MTETRLKELQTEIAKLKEIDNKTTERVVTEFEVMEFLNSGGDPLEIEIPCSLEQDMEWANESI